MPNGLDACHFADAFCLGPAVDAGEFYPAAPPSAVPESPFCALDILATDFAKSGTG
jgi:hypothetical protein